MNYRQQHPPLVLYSPPHTFGILHYIECTAVPRGTTYYCVLRIRNHARPVALSRRPVYNILYKYPGLEGLHLWGILWSLCFTNKDAALHVSPGHDMRTCQQLDAFLRSLTAECVVIGKE